jgi:hypothetical protein
MREIAAQGTRVAIGTSGTSPTAGGVDVEQDTNDFSSELFIDPFPLLVDGQSNRGSLVISVEMLATAQIAFRGSRSLGLFKKGVGGTGRLITPSIGC